MGTIVRIHNESEYNEILRQAVAVIETARGNAARAIVSTSNEMHWRIGQLLYERKLERTRGWCSKAALGRPKSDVPQNGHVGKQFVGDEEILGPVPSIRPKTPTQRWSFAMATHKSVDDQTER